MNVSFHIILFLSFIIASLLHRTKSCGMVIKQSLSILLEELGKWISFPVLVSHLHEETHIIGDQVETTYWIPICATRYGPLRFLTYVMLMIFFLL
jgi:hypothetical protein